MERVILVHGLWMPGASMRWLAVRLREQGYHAEIVSYFGALRGEAELEKLTTALRRGPAHVVAHSLGGVVTLRALEAEPELPAQRVVCLGSPLRGSGAARSLERWRTTRLMLGQSLAFLERGCRPWHGRAQVGAIAGSLPYGLGHLFGRFDGPHDGTVAVAETRLEGLADHAVVRASHMGLLVSKRVLALTVQFLRTGRFQP